MSSSLQSALSGYEAAAQHLRDSVKDEIRAGLYEAFKDPEVKTVSFGVSTDPYNDENAGQGTFGPVVNHDFGGYDAETDEVEDLTSDDRYALIYDQPRPDPRATNLGRVLSAAGWKWAGEALGVPYYENEGHGHTVVFVAYRDANKRGGFSLENFDIEY